MVCTVTAVDAVVFAGAPVPADPAGDVKEPVPASGPLLGPPGPPHLAPVLLLLVLHHPLLRLHSLPLLQV